MKYCIPLFSIFFALVVASCNSPELLGVELLNDETILVEFTDIVNPVVSTIEDDSILIFATDGFNLRNSEQWPLGSYSDPAFGSASSIIYVTTGIGDATLPDFKDATFDSLVVILPLDTLARYGDTLSGYDVSVHRLDAFPSSSTTIADRIDTIYADQSFDFDPSPLGQINVVPKYFDSILVYSPVVDSLIDERPSLRIPLDANFAAELLDTAAVTSDEVFQGVARGFALVAEGSNPGFIGLNLDNFSSTSTNATLAMYYRDSSDVASLYNFSLGIFKSATYSHDYAGSDVSIALNGDPTKSYIQGMAGVNTAIDLSDVMQFQGKGINYAELEITVDESWITPETPAVESVFAIYNQNGNTILVSDASLTNGTEVYDFAFDGSLQTTERDGQTVMVYKIILTNHIIDLLKGEVETPFIELIPLSKIETPYRSVLYGNSGDDNEIRLNLVITTP